jgi:choline dehydrogenase
METYDYVVVGAGSAGCVVASRLTEDPNVRVLLLEAGGPDRASAIRVPAAFGTLFKTAVDWQFHTEEQPRLKNRRLYWPRGKVLGGCSSINAMIYVRGHPSDYDAWKAAGNDGWGYADVLPYFKKSERHCRGASAYHGTGGPLHVADLRCVNPLTRVFLEACAQSGIPRSEDFNGVSQEGASLYPVNQKGGLRHSAADAFLKPAAHRPNLTIATEAATTRLLFEGQRAVGVEYQQNGSRRLARAGAEVVLCSGAIGSPQLLMLSGIGPRERLEPLGIPVRVDLPGVGQNLQDHLVIGVHHRCRQPITLDKADTLFNRLRLVLFGRGPLSSNVGEAGAFVKSDPTLPAPDLQLYFGPCFFINHGFVRPEGHGFTLGACLLRPRSRGHVTLRSADPFAPPVIQPDYLADDADLKTLIAGVRLVRRIAAASAFDTLRGEEHLPGEPVQTDEEIADYVRRMVETIYHPVGTCKMGTDAQSVVNSRLQVYGIEALRVVDASIMPILVGGNTHAPTVMIAEKGADLIRAGQ